MLIEKRRMRGFTLIASLLVLVLLSGVAIGLMYLTNGEGHIGSNDLEDNLAYYGAESGMEKMTSDLSALYTAKMAPSSADIHALETQYPDPTMINNMAYFEKIDWQKDANGNPVTRWNTISGGTNQGLVAEIVPLTMQAKATRPSGASVNMYRTVEVALIPVFQFGVFSDSDLSYFAGPPFEFQGRVHTNGNLYLASNNGPLVLDDKISAAGEIVRDRLANNWNGGGYQGGVYIPTTAGACDPPIATAIANGACRDLTVAEGSWNGSIPPAPPSVPNYGGWAGITSAYNGFVNSNVKPLVLPFVQQVGNQPNSSSQQIQIIRKPPAGEAPSSPVGSSRLYNKAQIRVLLANTEADLRPGVVPIDSANNVQLDGLSLINVSGTPAGSTSWFAVAQTTAGDLNWNTPGTMPRCGDSLPGAPCVPYTGAHTSWWPLVRGWLRVEYLDSATGKYVGVTQEWLKLGFARSLVKRTAPGIDALGHPSAILLFQKIAQHNDGTIPNASITGSFNNFYPINFYDTREGEPRDAVNGSPFGASTCRMNGIMNAVELDVGNLRQWLLGNIGASGTKVNSTDQNGYILYFSDRRGMENVPLSVVTNGEYGFEDVINSADPAKGQPDGLLEALAPNGFSPEDVDENNALDIWGAADVGDGFGTGALYDTHGTLNTNYWGPYQQIDCMNGGRQAWVSGARHGLKLIDGSLGNLPTQPAGTGGFTVASENPVYIVGDYNSGPGDPFWGSPTMTGDVPHAAASVIADAVSLLSNNWTDENSLANPTSLGNRVPADTYYRTAIAAGKNMIFPHFTGGADFGTDGGVHNFLRLLETWGGRTLSYRGSLVSLYYAQYNTGTFKCCNLVYGAPNRNFYFDWEFLDPKNLPPGTPMFQDVVNLNFHQDFTPQ